MYSKGHRLAIQEHTLTHRLHTNIQHSSSHKAAALLFSFCPLYSYTSWQQQQQQLAVKAEECPLLLHQGLRSVHLVLVIPLLCLSISRDLLGGGGRSISYRSCQSNKTTGNPVIAGEGVGAQDRAGKAGMRI